MPDDAIAWVQHCACQKPKDLGYSYELWTYRLLLAHIRQHCVAMGHPALLKLSRSKLHKILRQGELRPHKIRYYVEKRDADFETKMASVLHVYKEVEIVNEYRRGDAGRQLGMVTISYDREAWNSSVWPRRRRIGRRWWVHIPATSGITSTCDWVRCHCWPVWTCTLGE